LLACVTDGLDDLSTKSEGTTACKYSKNLVAAAAQPCRRGDVHDDSILRLEFFRQQNKQNLPASPIRHTGSIFLCELAVGGGTGLG
jgi:hypothetical protein